jgi:hypothetical protein
VGLVTGRSCRVVGSVAGEEAARMTGDVLPFPDSCVDPDWGVCRVCGRCLMLVDGVLAAHVSDPDRTFDHRPIPEALRCRGEGYSPL